MQQALPDSADMHTPYGATEALPVCSITAREVLSCTALKTRTGAGTCVGRPFPEIRLKIVEITDGPIESLSAVRELPRGEIGEIIVRGAVVTRAYFHQEAATRAAKIPDGDGFWHRMGDVGRLDAEGALWFCGRKSHIVETEQGRMFTECCEPIFNAHPRVFRSALVGVGDKPRQTPVIVIELERGRGPVTGADLRPIEGELLALAAGNPLTASIGRVLFHPSLPVDVRHNVKISREKLATWAAAQP
jgi:acyl-CoA synthetase (AMP-forming)/AMP-acid ligase II